MAQIAPAAGRPRSAVYRAIMEARAEKLTAATVKYHDDPLYHDDAQAAEEHLRDLVRQAEQALPEKPEVEMKRVPRGLPPYLAELYRTPLLSPGLERALFLQFNFHKYCFAELRGRLDPHLCRRRDLDRLERHLRLARKIKNRIVTANLRLVVSVARKHLRRELDLMELVSDGNIVLMRAAEGFDVHRGFRFSTYATLALMKGFARSVPEMQAARAQAASALAEEIAQRDESYVRVGDRDQLDALLERLSEQERRVVAAHYGLGERDGVTLENLSKSLGVTKHRIRQIEQSALGKLRRLVADSSSPAAH
jgi:RNA polymerase sigma factor (sigma-70 family)